MLFIDDNIISSPVDGKVVAIEKVSKKSILKMKEYRFLFSCHNKFHVTRYALSGKVNFSKYHPGKYLVAWHPKSSEKK